MPTVPLVSSTSVNIQSPGGGGYLSVGGADSPEAFGAGVGRAESQLGATIEHTGDMLAKHAEVLQDRANQAWANDAFVKSTEALGDQMEWLKSQRGLNAVEAHKTFVQKTDEIRQKFLAGAPNIEAARMFDMDAKRRIGFLNVDAGSYAGNQFRSYETAAAQGKQTVALQMAGQAKDDAEFKTSMQFLVEGALAEQRTSGLPPEVKEAQLNTKVSQAYQTRAAGIALTDPFRAEKFINENRDKIKDPNVLQHIDQMLIHQKEAVGTRIVSSAIENGLPIPNVPGLGGGERGAIGAAETGHIKNTEDRYKAEGPVITDPKSKYYGDKAYGFYQMMGKNIPQWTEEALGKRMTPEEFKNDPEAQDKTFDYQFGKLKEKYGNFADAASAWHSGRPLAEATAAGASDGFMRTADYVKKASAALGQGPGPLTPNSGPEWKQQATAQAVAAAKVLAPNDPNFETMLVQRVQSKYNNVKSMTDQVYRENYNTIKGALFELDPNTGKPTITDPGQILDNPEMNARYQALDDIHKKAVLNQVTKNALRDVPATNENFRQLQEIMGMKTTSPADFMKVDTNSLDMPRAFKAQIFAAQRALEKSQAQDPGFLRALNTVHGMLNDADIGSSASDKAKNARYNQFVGAYQTAYGKWIEENGGKTPNIEQSKQIASQLLSNTERPGRFFGTNTMHEFEVPSNEIDKINEVYQRRLKRDATPQEAYNAYQKKINNAQ